MNALLDGGPAFPGYWENDSESNATAPDGAIVPPMTQHGISGMSLRDYFAAKAMQTYLDDPACRNNNDKLAAWSYEAADAMLKARQA